jgi:L-cystine uptake protein TcyP (sodium:dicarboxylate symporter family)
MMRTRWPQMLIEFLWLIVVPLAIAAIYVAVMRIEQKIFLSNVWDARLPSIHK